VPIALDGMVIEPGDLVIGDDDGLLCVPFDDTESLYEAARTKREAEEKTLAATMAGRLDPKTWVDESLKRLGCEGV
jgi:regulator of RNase E activity RraA